MRGASQIVSRIRTKCNGTTKINSPSPKRGGAGAGAAGAPVAVVAGVAPSALKRSPSKSCDTACVAAVSTRGAPLNAPFAAHSVSPPTDDARRAGRATAGTAKLPLRTRERGARAPPARAPGPQCVAGTLLAAGRAAACIAAKASGRSFCARARVFACCSASARCARLNALDARCSCDASLRRPYSSTAAASIATTVAAPSAERAIRARTRASPGRHGWPSRPGSDWKSSSSCRRPSTRRLRGDGGQMHSVVNAQSRAALGEQRGRRGQEGGHEREDRGRTAAKRTDEAAVL